MRCRVCGGLLEPRVTDLPFKIGDSSIVILKSLPVLQCDQCGDTESEQTTVSRVDQISRRSEWIRGTGGHPICGIDGLRAFVRSAPKAEINVPFEESLQWHASQVPGGSRSRRAGLDRAPSGTYAFHSERPSRWPTSPCSRPYSVQVKASSGSAACWLLSEKATRLAPPTRVYVFVNGGADHESNDVASRKVVERRNCPASRKA